jgi:hypothetical protein
MQDTRAICLSDIACLQDDVASTRYSAPLMHVQLHHQLVTVLYVKRGMGRAFCSAECGTLFSWLYMQLLFLAGLLSQELLDHLARHGADAQHCYHLRVRAGKNAEQPICYLHETILS